MSREAFFEPSAVLGSLFFALAVALVAAPLSRVDHTVAFYGALAVATVAIGARIRSFHPFAVYITDAPLIAASSAVLALLEVVQHVVPVCVGLCGSDVGWAAADPVQLLVTGFVLAPFAESLLVQGWIFAFAAFAFDRRIAVAVSACAFVLLHLSLSPLLAAAAVILTLLRERTGRLGPVIIVHAIANIEATVLHALVP